MKSGYTDSLKNEFSVLHTSVCREISNMFDSNKFSCDYFPLEVNFINNTKITMFKSNRCYTLELTDDGKEVKSSVDLYYGNEDNINCKGTMIGFAEWNTENEYYKKTGGYETIKEIALYAYKNNGAIDSYFDISHVLERGGDPKLYTTYTNDLKRYFGGLTGKWISSYVPTTEKNTNVMYEYLYYVKK